MHQDWRTLINPCYEVNKFETEEVNEDIIPDYQKEILTTRSKNEINNTATISDYSPPEIVINESIEINGDVANLEFNVFDKSNIEEYDFRAGFCMSAVIENVWPNQPGFTKKFRNEVCDEYGIPFIKVVCKEFI